MQARSQLPPLTRALSSDLSRARDTATLMLEGTGLPLVQLPALRERDLGPWAHEPRADFSDFHLFLTWHGAPPGAESQADIAARVLPCLAALPEVEGNTLVVAHGGVLLDGVPLEDIGRNKVRNCEVLVRQTSPAAFAALHRGLP